MVLFLKYYFYVFYIEAAFSIFLEKDKLIDI